MIDLYPNEDYNFVFGRASLLDGIGVFSFARHHPYFFDKDKDVSVASLNELNVPRRIPVIAMESY